MTDMRSIYQANNEEQGNKRLLEFEIKWGKKYPLSCKLWLENWVKLSAFSNMTKSCARLFIRPSQLKVYTDR
jgi:transposase-like protein